MANRLKEIMKRVVVPTQSSFASGIQIVDNIIVYQKVLHSMHSIASGEGIMTLKIDLEKAYDYLS